MRLAAIRALGENKNAQNRRFGFSEPQKTGVDQSRKIRPSALPVCVVLRHAYEHIPLKKIPAKKLAYSLQELRLCTLPMDACSVNTRLSPPSFPATTTTPRNRRTAARTFAIRPLGPTAGGCQPRVSLA